jgi:peptidoglycan/xylan/chitin deacetylase (PgdA/CDA1 family)
MRHYRPFFLIRKIFAKAVFRIKTDEKILCLTFDDGPNPGSTYRILNILDNYQVKAIFFLTGLNVEKYPGIKELIVAKGHQLGNHGYLHKKGCTTSSENYAKNISMAARLIPSDYYRPPYGSLTPKQYHNILKYYTLIFWDLMPYDFSRSHSAGRCLRILKEKIRPGSIIVLHDNPSSIVTEFLAEFIESATGEGYKFVVPVFAKPEKNKLR